MHEFLVRFTLNRKTVEETVRAVSGFEAKEQIKNKYGSSNVTIINCKDLKFGWMV